MKKARFLIVFMLILGVVLGLAACGDEPCTHADADSDGKCDKCGATMETPPCTEHTDADADGKCDTCGADMGTSDDPGNEPADGEITLIEGGKATFQFVAADGLSSSVRRKIDALAADLAKLGISVAVVDDAKSTEQSCEVLIGPVTSRGEKYVYDMYSLGKKGYAITAIDGKVIVAAGDLEALGDVIDTFKKDFLGIKSGVSSLGDVVLTEEDWIVKIQDNYKVKSLTVNGATMKGHVLITNTSNKLVNKVALTFQDTVYERTGIYLPIVDAEKATAEQKAAAVYVVHTTDAGNDGFRVRVDGNSLVIETEFDNKMAECVEKFITTYLVLGGKEVDFKKTFSYKEQVRVIYYEDFGATGDGLTNDFPAIRDAHEYANLYGHTVSGKNGAKYYIGRTGGTSAVIETDVNWNNIEFIIDDTLISDSSEDYSERNANIFYVAPEYDAYSLTKEEIAAIVNADGGIDKTVTKLNYAPGHPTMLIFYNSNHKQYIRYGANANSGSDQHELIIIDAEGNIDPLTPFLFDYDEVTSVTAYRIDDKTITISGGTFTTKANRADSRYNYYGRGFSIRRSNVTIQNLTHKITGEGETGAPYNGFFAVGNCNNFKALGCQLSGHKTYTSKDNGTGMGSYDISGGNANGIYFKDCVQLNFYTDSTNTSPDTSLWGIMGTNYCKNITYEDCTLSRLDAHAGVYNATVKNTKIVTISLIGGGTALIENSTIYFNYGNTAVTLRSDYGGLWDGDIILRNVDIKAKASKPQNSTVHLVGTAYDNHYFGYEVKMPTTIIVDGLTVSDTKNPTIYVFSDPTKGNFDFSADRVDIKTEDRDENGNLVGQEPDTNGKYKNYNPIVLTKDVIIANVSNEIKAAIKSSPDEFLQKAVNDGRINLRYMTKAEYDEYLAAKND